MDKSKRLLELDVFRGIAALGVVLFHYTSRYNELYGHSQELLMSFPYGKKGVQLFFIISGFLILVSLERTKRSLDFIVGRFARLYPAYWVAVILTFTIVAIAGLPGREVTWNEALFNLTMFQELFKVPHVDGAYWTLQIELSFYLIMLILYQKKLLKYIESIAIGWLLLMAITIGFESQNILILPQTIKIIFLLNYANFFIAGIMFYKIYQQGVYFKTTAIIAACVFVYKLDHSWFSTLDLALFFVAFYLMLRGSFAFINCKPLIFLGTISYTLYLVHQNIGYVIIRTLDKTEINPHVIIFLALVLSIVIATAITFLVEQPMLHFIKKQYKTRVLNKMALR
ncbi:MAG: acyltransferase [Cyanobacteriota bacterium]